MRCVVLDIGGTAIKSGIYENGQLNGVREQDTDAGRGGEYVMQRAMEIIRCYSDYERIGISTAGQVDSGAGRIRYANSNIPGYTGMEIRRRLEEEFQVPAAVENDVNAAALGEAVCGAGRDFRDFLCLTYGTGVGGAIVIDRKLYRGNSFSAGEFGGIVVHPEDRRPVEDPFSGCYERYASTTALVKRAMRYDPLLSDGRKIFNRLEEEPVKKIVDGWIEEILHGLITLIHIFNPSCILLGGGVMRQKYIVDQLNVLLYNNIIESFRDVTLRQTQLGNHAGLYGAAHLAEGT